MAENKKDSRSAKRAEEKQEKPIKLVSNFNPDRETPLFKWQAPEFVRYKKTAKWFFLFLLVAAGLAAILYWQGQKSGAWLVVVAFLVLTIISNAKPKKISCAVYRDGLVVDDKVYDFNQFKSFWTVPGEIPKIRLQLTGRFVGQVVLPIADVDPEQVRLFLGKFLPEEDRGPDFTDMINGMLRF